MANAVRGTERSHWRGECPAQHHLERDDPVEAGSLGLVDDSHAAARDLFEQFVLAEVADRLGQRQRIGTNERLVKLSRQLKRRGDRLNLIEVLEEGGQLAREFRMIGDEALPIGRFTPFDRREVVGDQGIEIEMGLGYGMVRLWGWLGEQRESHCWLLAIEFEEETCAERRSENKDVGWAPCPSKF